LHGGHPGVAPHGEAEAEAETGIVDRLADNALKNVLKTLSDPDSAGDRQKAVQDAAEHFKRTANTRARRYGRDVSDRSVRYRRHIAALRRALEREQTRHTGAKAAALEEVSVALGGA